MHSKFIQISTVLTPAGVALYALDDKGDVYEKLVGIKNSTWVKIAS
jgi:hypothetical protein